MNKTCFIIAGPNGAGKTTFARDFLPNEGECLNYINADLIAAGLSPFQPERVSVMAGKIMLAEIQRTVEAGLSFAFETTLSGLTYIRKIETWRKLGYRVVLYYFSLPSVDMAIERVRYRVSQGGHNIPEDDIRRRFSRSRLNFDNSFKSIVDAWVEFDTSNSEPILIRSYNDEK